MNSNYHLSMANESILDSIISGFFKRGGKVRENPDLYKGDKSITSKEDREVIYEAVDEFLYRNRFDLIDLVKKDHSEMKFSIDDFVWTTYREYNYYTRRTNEHKAFYISGIYIASDDDVWMIRIDLKYPSDIKRLPNDNINDILINFRMWQLDSVVNQFLPK